MRAPLPLTVALFPVALVALAGCSVVFDGSEHTGGTPDSGPPDAGSDAGPTSIAARDLCSEISEILCESAVRCCGAERTRCAGMEESCIDACVLDYLPECTADIEPLVTDPVAGYDPIAAGAVVDALREYGAECSVDAIRPLVVDLLEVPPGTLPAGDRGCDPRAGEEFNVLAALYCEPGLECLSENGMFAGMWMCGRPRPSGQPCVTYLECEEGLGCAGGRCGSLRSAGEPCRLGGDCISGLCVQTGLFTYGCADVGAEDFYCNINARTDG